MARRTFRARPSTPRSTTSAAPQTTTVSLAQGTLEHVWIVIPSGHAGLTGIALVDSGEHIFPWGASSWLQGDDEVIEIRLDYQLAGSTLDVVTYNDDDTYPHDHLLRFQILDLASPRRRIVRPLGITPPVLAIPAATDFDVDVPIVGDEAATEAAPLEEDATP